MSMTEVVEESLKEDARFRHLTVMPTLENLANMMLNGYSGAWGIPARTLLGYGEMRND